LYALQNDKTLSHVQAGWWIVSPMPRGIREDKMPAVDEEKELQSQALTVVQRAKAIVVFDQASYDAAADLLTGTIKPLRARWLEYWNPLRDAAYKSYKGILDKFNEADKPLELAERQVKAEIARWDLEQERIRQEEQRKAQMEAERVDRERRLAEAVEAEQAGAPEEMVSSILNTQPVVVAPVVEPTYQKASGIARRDNWKCKVENLKELCKAIGAGKVPVEYVLPNESALNARARADKSTMNLPGCKAYNESVISGRSR
jgi:hypothetical protein